MGIPTILVIVVSIVLVSFVIVASDPAERQFVKDLLLRLKPVLYGVLSVFVFLWLVSRGFEPLGGLGSELMDEATDISNVGGSPIRFLLSWLGAPIVGLVDILLMLTLVGASIFFFGMGVVSLSTEWRDLYRLLVIAAKRLWWWVLDLFVHPPSIKTIRETLRSGEPSAERVQKIAAVLEEEQKKVMQEGIPAEIVKSYARKHRALAEELSVAQMEARAEYNEALAKTAQGLRDSAVRRGGKPPGEGRDE